MGAQATGHERPPRAPRSRSSISARERERNTTGVSTDGEEVPPRRGGGGRVAGTAGEGVSQLREDQRRVPAPQGEAGEDGGGRVLRDHVGRADALRLSQ